MTKITLWHFVNNDAGGIEEIRIFKSLCLLVDSLNRFLKYPLRKRVHILLFYYIWMFQEGFLKKHVKLRKLKYDFLCHANEVILFSFPIIYWKTNGRNNALQSWLCFFLNINLRFFLSAHVSVSIIGLLNYQKVDLLNYK